MTDISKEAVERLATVFDKKSARHELGSVALGFDTATAATLRAQVARIAELEARQYKLAYAIAGGEDAYGLLDSIPTDDLCEMIRTERAQQSDWNDASATAARNEVMATSITMDAHQQILVASRDTVLQEAVNLPWRDLWMKNCSRMKSAGESHAMAGLWFGALARKSILALRTKETT